MQFPIILVKNLDPTEFPVFPFQIKNWPKNGNSSPLWTVLWDTEPKMLVLWTIYGFASFDSISRLTNCSQTIVFTTSRFAHVVYFSAIFGSFLTHFLLIFAQFLLILTQFWLIFGSILAQFLAHFMLIFCAILAQFWHIFGTFLAHFWL